MNKINTRKALNPAYRKHKPLRKDINNFTEELLACLKTVKLSDQQGESEEHIKDPIKTFLQKTFYKDNYINTKDRIDLAIYLGKDAKNDVGVIIEAKRPSNKTAFLTPENLNRKALQELLLYYLRERIDEKNNNIKHLIATNGYEWFLFNSEDFYKYFYKNKALVKEYESFRDGLKDSSKNELFYNDIAKKYIEQIEQDLPFVYLDFTKKSINEYSDKALNTLYKIFSDVHLLGHSFGNDSNQLNKSFYNELLHIIGLEEKKIKGKKLIDRKPEKERDYASILENTIFIIEDRDYLINIKSIEKGKDKAFNAGLELTLTWVNRILFLKLLESQLLSYHNGAKEYKFLNSDFIKGYDDLNDLFFSALAKNFDERHPKYKDRFKYIPYLNSSLFERNKLENETFRISSLNDDEIGIYNQTVLKDAAGKRLKGKLSTLNYLFKFLDAYDFAADGAEGIEDSHENKTLINASVLGLIFEKINGYKEGSFYTPAYITMYMSRETLRRAVVQKFKEQENKQIKTFEDLKAYTRKFFKKGDLQKFNRIINSLRIIDPAVGSGHFLVSALNELISIKSELGILIDDEDLPLQSEIIIENDELYITDKFGHLFDYKPDIKETRKIQKTLFREKQNIIENCLFGVDINPNSVKICRLRLWIELLKNAYYTEDNQLQTLPNIDINIKTGNSLISRFNLQDDLKNAFKGKDVKYSFAEYKNAVAEYKETNDKNRKQEVLNIIEEVKNNFESSLDDKFIKDVQKAQAKFNDEKKRLENLKAFGETIKKSEKDKLKKLKEKSEKALSQKEDILNNAIYHNAFEWRFEFPEVLDDNGNYVGFDIVIGNPPYFGIGSEFKNKYFKERYSTIKAGDIYALFNELASFIMHYKGLNSFIISNKWLRAGYGESLRNFFVSKMNPIHLIDFGQNLIFENAIVHTNIIILEKFKNQNQIEAVRFNDDDKPESVSLNDYFESNKIKNLILTKDIWNILPKDLIQIKNKVQTFQQLQDYKIQFRRGILTGYNDAFILDENTRNKLIEEDIKNKDIVKPILRGRDTRRYYCNFNNHYVINSHNGIKSKNIKRINIEKDYPFIYNHLLNFKEKAQIRYDKGDEWTNLRNCAYLDEFEKPKIIFSEIVSEPQFYYDEEKYYPEATVFFISGEKLKYLTALLNSKMVTFLFKNFYMGGELVGKIRYKKAFLEKVPIPYPSKEQEQPIITKVNEILKFKKGNSKTDTTTLEAEIDKMVYELYELTEEEIGIVENS